MDGTTPLFHEIEGAYGVTHSKGLFRQVKLFHRGGYLYARHGSGFVRVYTHGGTSLPTVSLAPENIDLGDSGFALEKEVERWSVRPANRIAAE